MKHLPAVLVLAILVTTGCNSSKRQNDSPKRESTGAASSASEGYKDENQKTPAAPAKSQDQGTGMNTGDNKRNTQPDTMTSVPGTDKPGQGPSNGQSNETTPPKK